MYRTCTARKRNPLHASRKNISGTPFYRKRRQIARCPQKRRTAASEASQEAQGSEDRKSHAARAWILGESPSRNAVVRIGIHAEKRTRSPESAARSRRSDAEADPALQKRMRKALTSAARSRRDSSWRSRRFRQDEGHGCIPRRRPRCRCPRDCRYTAHRPEGPGKEAGPDAPCRIGRPWCARC